LFCPLISDIKSVMDLFRSVWFPNQLMERILPVHRWQAWKFRLWKWTKMATLMCLTLKPWYVQWF